MRERKRERERRLRREIEDSEERERERERMRMRESEPFVLTGMCSAACVWTSVLLGLLPSPAHHCSAWTIMDEHIVQLAAAACLWRWFSLASPPQLAQGRTYLRGRCHHLRMDVRIAWLAAAACEVFSGSHHFVSH